MASTVPMSNADLPRLHPNRKRAIANRAFWLGVPAAESGVVTSCSAIPVAFGGPRFVPDGRDRASAGGCNPPRL